MKNVKELNLTIGEKYTVLNAGDLVPTRYYGTLMGYYFDKWAQYENALYIYIKRPRARRVDRLVFTTDKLFIFKDKFEDCWRKEVVSETEQATTSLLHRFTYNDVKDNENLVYYNDGLVDGFKPVTDNFEYLLDMTGDFIDNNNLKPIEAPENASYIDYIRTLLTRYNVNDLLNYIKAEGYSLLEKSINKAVEYKW